MATFPSKVDYTTGEVLTAAQMNDIGGAINLLDGAQFAAGKNKIINGDFGINQRSFTSNTASGAFNFDRFFQLNGGSSGTLTITPQTFTAGTAPVAGYEGTNFVRCVTAAGVNTNTYALLEQKIEDVRTFAGQTVTASFWAKAGSGTPNISIELEQSFGSGGSASVFTSVTKTAITTSWARYTFTVAVPSISGKTIGTGSALILGIWLSAGSDFNTRSNTTGLQNGTFDIWGVQVEAASTASNFQTATGTKQGELAACQRYYYRIAPGNANAIIGSGQAISTTQAVIQFPLKSTLRISPNAVEYAGNYIGDGVTAILLTSVAVSGAGANCVAVVAAVAAGATQYRPYQFVTLNTTDYIAWSAEL
jgi:hypothetical protein